MPSSSPYSSLLAVASLCVLAGPACSTVACLDEPEDRSVSLASFAEGTLVIGSGRAVLEPPDGWDEDTCPVLSADVVATDGAFVSMRGGAHCGTKEMTPHRGCEEVAFLPSRADESGMVTVAARDGSHRILVRATDPSHGRRLEGEDVRRPRGGTVSLAWRPRGDAVTGPRAVLRAPSFGARVLARDLTDSEVIVHIPNDIPTGQYTLTVTLTASPRFAQCEGVRVCRFQSEPPSRTVERTITVEVE